MAIADIKKFINDKQEEMYYADKGDYFIPPNDVGNILEVILNMLDELEPEAKWKHDGSQWENRFICSKCGHKIFEEQQPYCSNCGARMEKANDERKNIL